MIENYLDRIDYCHANVELVREIFSIYDEDEHIRVVTRYAHLLSKIAVA